MAWFGRKEEDSKIPEKYRNMTPEQLVSAIEKAETLEKDTTDLKAALAEKDTKITEHSTELETMRERIKGLEANQKPPEKKEDKTEVAFMDDPEGYLKQEINRVTGPVAVHSLNTNAQLARLAAREMLSKIKVSGTRITKAAMWDKYVGDIDKLAKTTNVGQLQTPDAWCHLFNMVAGQHMDEILSGKVDEMFVEPGSSSVDRGDDSEHKTDKPTDEEIRIAKRMRIPIEKYMEQKKGLTFA